MAWIKANSFAGSQIILSKNTSDGWGGWEFLVGSGNFGVEGNFGGQNTAGGFQISGTNQWQHVAAIYDGASMKMEINGVVFAPSLSVGQFSGAALVNDVPLRFGRRDSPLDYWFLGQLDDIRIYNRALSPSEVQQLYEYESQTHVAGAFQLVYGRYSWPEAKADAESRGGHLATSPYQTKWNSAQPLINQFNSQIAQDLWIGAYQPVGSPEPAGGWSWVTGEPWNFTLWWPGEPNQNQGQNEDSVFVGFGGAGWNDAPGTAKISYVLEFGPRVDLIKAVKPSFKNLALTTNYQLQISGDLNSWTNQGSAFTATNINMIWPQYFDVDNWGNLFFRLQVAP